MVLNSKWITKEYLHIVNLKLTVGIKWIVEQTTESAIGLALYIVMPIDNATINLSQNYIKCKEQTLMHDVWEQIFKVLQN